MYVEEVLMNYKLAKHGIQRECIKSNDIILDKKKEGRKEEKVQHLNEIHHKYKLRHVSCLFILP